MSDQAHFWSAAAPHYEQEFIDPYLPDVRNPLRAVLAELAGPANATVADLGCGIGPLLPFLSQHFRSVLAIDFAEGMLRRAVTLSGIEQRHLPPARTDRPDRLRPR